jgi:hypothetical protein
MVVDNGYQDGLDAFLNRKIDSKELSNDIKGILYSLMEGIPGVGLVAYGIREYKTRKGKIPLYSLKKPEDRRALKVLALEAGYFALAVGWKFYVGNGIITKDWFPFDNSKSKTEQVDNLSRKDKKLERKGKLEKTIDYEKLFIK